MSRRAMSDRAPGGPVAALLTVALLTSAVALLAWTGVAGAAQVPAPFPDFDGDGYGDVVVPAAREDVSDRDDAGVLHVLYGSASRVTATGNRTFVESPGSANAEFGRSFAAGDFDADGFDDLAVGAPGARIGGAAGAGAVTVLYGGPDGLTTDHRYRFTQSTAHVPGGAEAWDRLGWSLAAGDFDGDGDDDLAAGAPGEDVGDLSDAGTLHVFFGSSIGLRATGSRALTQDSRSVSGLVETGDEFALALTAGDFDRDGRDDIAVGVPREDVGRYDDSGAVWILTGSAAGPSGAGGLVLTQNTAGVAGAHETADGFGWSLAAGDVHGDGYTDLAVGVPGEDVGAASDAGCVYLLAGGASGLTGARSQLWAQETPGVPGGSERQDYFGFTVALSDATGDGRADLATGAVGEGLGDISFAGAVTWLAGSPAGLATTGARQWTQGSPGVVGTPGDTELFGALVGYSDTNRDGASDLAIGVPGESIHGYAFAGLVHVLPGSAAGPTSAGATGWHQDSRGVSGTAEDDDWFGGTLEF